MPSGKVHTASNIGLALSLVTTQPWNTYKGWLVLGVLLETFLSPDLDVDKGYIGFRWLGPLGPAWRLFWLPYALIVKHRSPFSHWPVLGTAIRVAYLGIPAVIVLRWLEFDLTIPQAIVPLLHGLLLGDLLHYLLDFFDPD